jgi:hypothetical protein
MAGISTGATYTGVRSESLDLTDQEVWWALQDRYHRLEMPCV